MRLKPLPSAGWLLALLTLVIGCRDVPTEVIRQTRGTIVVEVAPSVSAGVRSRITTVATLDDSRAFSHGVVRAELRKGKESTWVVALDSQGEPVLEAVVLSGSRVELSYESTAHVLIASASGIDATTSRPDTHLHSIIAAIVERGESYYDDPAVISELRRLRPQPASPPYAQVGGYSELEVESSGVGSVLAINSSEVAFTASVAGSVALVSAKGGTALLAGLSDPTHTISFDLTGAALEANTFNLLASFADGLISALGLAGAGTSSFKECIAVGLTPAILGMLADAANGEPVDISSAFGGILLRAAPITRDCLKDYLENHLSTDVLRGAFMKRFALVTTIWDAARFALENGPFLTDFAFALAGSPFTAFVCRQGNGTYEPATGPTCGGTLSLFTLSPSYVGVVTPIPSLPGWFRNSCTGTVTQSALGGAVDILTRQLVLYELDGSVHYTGIPEVFSDVTLHVGTPLVLNPHTQRDATPSALPYVVEWKYTYRSAGSAETPRDASVQYTCTLP